MKKNKKAQIMDNLGTLAVGIAVLTITLVIAFLVMSEGKDSTVELIDSTTYTNSTKTITVNSFTTISGCIGDVDLSVSQLYNSSTYDGAVVLQADNYTISGNTINVSNKELGSVGGLDTSINMTYSCKTPSYGYNGTEELQNATDTVPGWVPLIVIAVVGALLLGLVKMFRQ